MTTWRRKIKFQNNPREWVKQKQRKARHDFVIHIVWGNDCKMRTERGERKEKRGGGGSNARK